MLWKIKIPSSERQKAIKELELYNVNAYSLFPSEESLMETVLCESSSKHLEFETIYFLIIK